jgi:hypothetical protein
LEWRQHIDRLLAAAGVLIAVFFIVSLLAYPHGRDQDIYSVVAGALLEGKPPYLGTWDFKPPGIYFVYALARSLFGTGDLAIRALEVLGLLSLVPAFVVLSRRFVGSSGAGWLAAWVGIAGYVELEYWNTAQPESFGGVLLAWALVCATYEPRGLAVAKHRRFVAWTAAATLFTLVALLKPPLGGGILVSLAFVLAGRVASPGAIQRYGLPLAAFALGGSLPLIGVLVYFWSSGALGALYETLFVFAPRYTALQLHLADAPGYVWTTTRIWLAGLSPYNAIGLVALVVLRPLHPRERVGAAHVLGVIAFSLLGVMLQAKFFPYHFGTAVILAALPAGWGLRKALLRARTTFLFAGLSAVVAALMLTGLPVFSHGADFWKRTAVRVEMWQHPEQKPEIEDWLYGTLDFDFLANRRAAQWVAANTSQEDAVYVWGFEPGIYRLSGRRPSTRYIYNVPQRAAWSRASTREELMHDLERDPPAVIVVEAGDVIPWVTGSWEDSLAALNGFPELERLIRAHYRPAAKIRNLRLYARRAR